MNPVLLLSMFGRKPELVTLPTFTANQTWTAPSGVFAISIVGRGAPGAPGTPAYSDADRTEYRTEQYAQKYTSNGSGGYFQDGAPFLVGTGDWNDFAASKPDDYCDPATGDFYYCYAYVHGSRVIEGEYHPATDPTTGASATGVGKTFVGGTGGAATPVTYNDVPVTPLSNYPLVIPTGAAIQISYYA